MILKEVKSANLRARGVKNAGCATAAGYGGPWSHCLIHFYVYMGGNTYFAVHGEDSNGTIARYYWDLDNNGESNKETPEPISYTDIGRWESEVSVWCKDDDSIQSEKLTFYLYPDSAPPAPTSFPYSTEGDSTIILQWNRKLDAHDSLETKVQVVTCYGLDCTPSDSLFSSGAEPTIAEIEQMWPSINTATWNGIKFNKATGVNTGDPGRWRVILIDARGSRTPAPASDPATFVAP